MTAPKLIGFLKIGPKTNAFRANGLTSALEGPTLIKCAPGDPASRCTLKTPAYITVGHTI
jgi:hypothetical protein